MLRRISILVMSVDINGYTLRDPWDGGEGRNLEGMNGRFDRSYVKWGTPRFRIVHIQTSDASLEAIKDNVRLLFGVDDPGSTIQKSRSQVRFQLAGMMDAGLSDLESQGFLLPLVGRPRKFNYVAVNVWKADEPLRAHLAIGLNPLRLNDEELVKRFKPTIVI